MYSLSEGELRRVLGIELESHGVAQEYQAEAEVQRTLPFIAHLDATDSVDERQAIYAATIREQLTRFVIRNGSAFGCIEEQKVLVYKKEESRERVKTLISTVSAVAPGW